MQQKKVGWEVIFSELGFADPGAAKAPAGVQGQHPRAVFHVFSEA